VTMPGRTAFRWGAASALLAFAAGACGGGAGGQGKGGAGGAGGAGPVSPNACALFFPSDSPSAGAALGLLEAQLVAMGRQNASFAAVLGEDAGGLLAASDALQTQAVEAAAADRMIPLPLAPPVEIPDPGTCGVTASALTASGGQWANATFLASGELLVAIDGNTGEIKFPPRDMSTTDPVSGTVTSVVHQETEVALSLSGSQAMVVVNLTRTLNAWTPAGASLGSTRETATATIEVDFCPDEAGVAAGKMSFVGQGAALDATGAPAGTYDVQAMGTYAIHVNEMAETSSIDVSSSIQFAASGASSVDVAETFSGSYTDPANLGGLKGQVQIQRQTGPAADVGAMEKAVYASVLLASKVAEGGAKKEWQHGSCVVVRVDPGSMMVDPDSQLTVMATPFQKIEMQPIDAPVVATFTGMKSLEPVNKPVAPAPASFTFVAGSNKGEKGVVDLKSTSRRGIGTGSATYIVKCGDATTSPMAKMCAERALALDPDTCTCVCRVDPVLGNNSPDCRWAGAISVTENDTGQLTEPWSGGKHTVDWSYTYDAQLSPLDTAGTLAGPVRGAHHQQDTYSTPPYDCTLVMTIDSSVAGNVTTGGHFGAVYTGTAGMLTLIIQLPVAPPETGSFVTDYVGPNCNGQMGMSSSGRTASGLDLLQVFVPVPAPAGPTFAGNAVYLNQGTPLPDGTSPKFNITWNLTLVPNP